MKFAWCKNITDILAWNSAHVEEVDHKEYSEMLEAEAEAAEQHNTDENKITLPIEIICASDTAVLL